MLKIVQKTINWVKKIYTHKPKYDKFKPLLTKEDVDVYIAQPNVSISKSIGSATPYRITKNIGGSQQYTLNPYNTSGVAITPEYYNERIYDKIKPYINEDFNVFYNEMINNFRLIFPAEEIKLIYSLMNTSDKNQALLNMKHKETFIRYICKRIINDRT